MKCLFIAVAMLFFGGMATAQSVEIYAGHKRAGVDLMWFKKIKNPKDSSYTPFLFFSRNRASGAYHNAAIALGSTNALSYNFENGLGIVAVGSFQNAGFTPKIGLQYATFKGAFMFFGWFAVDIAKKGNFDLFGLFRYQPAIATHWKFFGQLELFPVYQLHRSFWNITQRIRLGLRYRTWVAGCMADFNQSGKKTWSSTANVGFFFRNEF